MRKDGADGSNGGVVRCPRGVGSVSSEARASTVAREDVEDEGVPVVVELEAITSSCCTFF